MKVLFVFLLLGFFPIPTQAQQNSGAEIMSDLVINQTDTWVLLVDTFRTYFSFDISSSTANHCVYVVESATAPSNGLVRAGRRYCRKSGEPDWTGDQWTLTSRGWYGNIWVRTENIGVILHRVRW